MHGTFSSSSPLFQKPAASDTLVFSEYQQAAGGEKSRGQLTTEQSGGEEGWFTASTGFPGL